MIIESLVRLGRPFVKEGGLSSEDMIRYTTDVTLPNTRNFFQNICLVEVDSQVGCDYPRVVAHPLAEWGNWKVEGPSDEASKGARRKAREVFHQDADRAIGIPFTLPTGGTPLARQGYYPSPVYMVYEKSLALMAGRKDEVCKYLKPRAQYTIGWSPSVTDLSQIAEAISLHLPKPVISSAKTMAVIVVVDYRSAHYIHADGARSDGGRYATLAESRMYPGKHIVANLDRIVENLWTARLKEAEEKGSLEEGSCSFCGADGYTVSSYAKSWPLFSTTYRYPLPQELREDELVKSIGLCPLCYKSLVFGANLFYKTVQVIDRTITKELFSPTQSVVGKEGARQCRKVDDIFGSCFALPVLDEFLEVPDEAADFIAWSIGRPNSEHRSHGADLALDDLLGFEVALSEAISNEAYRLTVVYYMGNWSRGAVDFAAVIQDVMPSVARAVHSLCSLTARSAARIGRMISESWNELSGDSTDAIYRRRHSSLPFNLVLAYGGPYLWHSLDSVLHRRPLAVEPFIRNVARRLQDRATAVSISGDVQSRLGFRDEVVFCLAFSEFLDKYHAVIEKGELSPMSRWQDWLSSLVDFDRVDWAPKSVAEVGFATGTVVRTFARQYYIETKKDFIKHRVMTFGADLRPADIFSKGLSKIQEYALRLDIRTSAALRDAAAAVSLAFLGQQEEINKDRDVFMAAFWAGYQLAPKDLYPGVGKKSQLDDEEVEQHV